MLRKNTSPWHTWRKYRFQHPQIHSGTVKRAVPSIVLLVFVAAYSMPAFCQLNRITINITNIRSEKGLIRLALYDHKNQFPNDPPRSFDFKKTLDEEGCLEITLMDIPSGTYAISILDDEDKNNRMNINLLRMPKEGYGFSNNVEPGFNPPAFKKCSFRVEAGDTCIEIKIRYFRDKSK